MKHDATTSLRHLIMVTAGLLVIFFQFTAALEDLRRILARKKRGRLHIGHGHENDWTNRPDGSLKGLNYNWSPLVPSHHSGTFSDSMKCNHPHLNAVIGGREVKPHSQSWMVYILSEFPKVGKRRCSGTILSDMWIISAGHCFQDIVERAVFAWIIIGAHDISKIDQESPIVMRLSVQHVFVHEKFNKLFLFNDLALLRLPKKIPSDYPKASAACLPSSEMDPETHEVCTASGWGLMSLVPRMVSDTLQTIDVSVANCEPPRPQFICSRKRENVKKKQDTCMGDSGGPLIWKKGGMNIIAGVLSSGSASCDGSLFSVPTRYVRVSFYLDWISDTIRKHTIQVPIARGYLTTKSKSFC